MASRQERSNANRMLRFSEFSTIDWVQDSFRDRRRNRFNRSSSNPNNTPWISWFTDLYDAAQSWLVVALIGAMIGLNAALISVITAWLSDLKMGYCRQGWWLNEKFCCWEIEASPHGGSDQASINRIGLGGASGVLDAGGTEEGCDDWMTWTTIGPIRYLVYTLYAILFSYSAAKLVKAFAPPAAGSGISEIKCILSGFDRPAYLSFNTLGIKSITLPLAIASGLSVGKEGPSVHMAACIGNVVARLFQRFRRNQRKMQEVVTAASAAGVAVAFGSPVGGVLFAFEEMTVNFPIKTMWRSFFCAMIATVTLSAVNPFRTGKLVLFQVSYDRDWHFFEIGFFILIGLFGGLYGAFVIKYNLQVSTFRKKHLNQSAITEVIFLAGLTAIVGYFNRFMRIDMSESLEILFRECEGGGDYDGLCQSWAQWQMVNSLLLATILRTLLVVLSYGCRVPAGIFIPSMAVGATFGRMLGILVKALYRAYPHWAIFSACHPEKPCITPGTYALLGSAAALGGIMRITVSVVVIMFELTGALTYILPTMIVLMVTKAVSDFLVKGHGGIADQMIRLNGFPCLEKDDHSYGQSVSSIMIGRKLGVRVINDQEIREEEIDLEDNLEDEEDHLVLALPFKIRLSELRIILGTPRSSNNKPFSGWPVVRDRNDLSILGYVSSSELQQVINDANLKRYSEDVIVILSRRPNDSLLSSTSSTSGSSPNSYLNQPQESLLKNNEDQPVFSDHRFFEKLDLSYLVNPTPVKVCEKQAIEMVMSLFKKIGPRLILIESKGKLKGLISLKDVLRHQYLKNQHQNQLSDHSDLDEDHHGELEDLLEDCKDLFNDFFEFLIRWVKKGS